MEVILNFFAILPLKGVFIIAIGSILIFFIAAWMVNKNYINSNFMALRSNTDFYEPIFALIIYASLMLALLGSTMAREYKMTKYSAARFLFWSQPDLAATYDAAPLKIDYDALTNELYSSGKKLNSVFKSIPSDDLSTKILSNLGSIKFSDRLLNSFTKFTGMLFAVVIFVYFATAFQFAVNTVGTIAPVIGVNLILFLMAGALLFLVTYFPVLFDASDYLFAQQL